jgi:ABC-type glycerol-3-phosphate transport system substrate-binding protein
VYTGDAGEISWEFAVEAPGFYNLEVSYRTEKGTNSQIRRSIALDGEILHDGLRQAAFNRVFHNAKDTIVVKNHNEVRPDSIELYRETSVFVDDPQKRSLDPYLFYLSEGPHTLTFTSIKEPMTVTGLRFAAAPEVPSYAEYLAAHGGAPRYAGETVRLQAERTGGALRALRRSLPSISVKNAVFDPALEPYHPYYIVYNTIGGDTWRYPGEVIEWELEAPEAGLYNLSFKGRQSIRRGLMSYRSLKINGETPFAEAQNLAFPYSAAMANHVLGGEEPFLFYLKKGTNTLSMEAVLGDYGGPYAEVSESVRALNDLYRRVVQITGLAPDMYIDYEVSAKVADFLPVLRNEYRRLKDVVERLEEFTLEKGSDTVMIEKLITELELLSDHPDGISRELGMFKGNISNLASWLITVGEMPLELDSISLLAPGAEPAPPRANGFRRAANDAIRFFATFFVDATKVDSDTAVKKNVLKVWIPSGRDQAQVLRNLIDERFIPEYGIAVNLELVPKEVVIPSSLAGVGPDVALSLEEGKVMDFALRRAVEDLSALEGFNREAEKFFPSAFEGVTFQGKIYGMPETQTFPILFYRKDILDSLGLRPPETWDELRTQIPVYDMNNYDVWAGGQTPFSSLVIQKGGDLYAGGGNDYGIKSGLAEEPDMEAFSELTDFYTAYRLPVTVDFNNRFRTGEIPLGIADYTVYCTLELFAPEIRGLWSFAAFPGTAREDGTVDHRVVSAASHTVMLTAAEKRGLKDEAWAFIKWWTRTDIQAEYANGIEAVLGTSARYPSANPEVLVQLPWAAADARKLLEQFAATRGIPAVPGSYMTSRMVDYAYKAVVAGKAEARETLFLNIKDVNAELTKKRKEFGLSYLNQ